MDINKKKQFENLRDKFVERHNSLQKNLWGKHNESLEWFKQKTKQLAVSTASLMLLAAPKTLSLPLPHAALAQEAAKIDKGTFLISDLSNILPKEVRELSTDEEKTIGDILSRDFGIKVSAELENKRLNRSYGYIGQEQHLARFPGDAISSHFENDNETNKFSSYGMAPGLGAWGHFVPAGSNISETDKLREKYYIAVQTFLAPGFNENPRELIDFFKFRKMLVVNPNNGKAVVAVIGDAGPADWTRKHLGGSPEVMSYLERYDGAQKGPVLYYFIDDPSDSIPLGPISIK